MPNLSTVVRKSAVAQEIAPREAPVPAGSTQWQRTPQSRRHSYSDAMPKLSTVVRTLAKPAERISASMAGPEGKRSTELHRYS